MADTPPSYGCTKELYPKFIQTPNKLEIHFSSQWDLEQVIPHLNLVSFTDREKRMYLDKINELILNQLCQENQLDDKKEIIFNLTKGCESITRVHLHLTLTDNVKAMVFNFNLESEGIFSGLVSYGRSILTFSFDPYRVGALITVVNCIVHSRLISDTREEFIDNSIVKSTAALMVTGLLGRPFFIGVNCALFTMSLMLYRSVRLIHQR